MFQNIWNNFLTIPIIPISCIAINTIYKNNRKFGSFEGVAGHDEQARGKVLQQDRGVVDLDFGGQGCEAILRGSAHTVWDYFGMRGFVLGSWEMGLLCIG